MILELRGLVGEWEDGTAIFLGAVPVETYEALCEDGANEGTNPWEDRKQEWVERGPHGVGETREIDIRLSLPDWTFATPEATARSLPADDGGGE